jgi:N4-(beta-N-acetylglucosaminyl)-L-asparaginase
MPTRRRFLTACALAGAALGTTGSAAQSARRDRSRRRSGPLVASTWHFGAAANAAAWEVLESGGTALDAVEQGARVPEADPEITTVGRGGLPDRDGRVTLDASIMDDRGRAGSVCFLEGIVHAVSVARRVMEATPHVMLAGEGARRFALEQGFAAQDLLTDRARAAWQEWRRESRYEPLVNPERHDTLGILALDGAGRPAGACTTSGMAFKLHGRVGDSPIIGAALFVDGEVGAATATGHGEYVMRTAGSFLVVELMRRGRSPQTACEEAMARVAAGAAAAPGEVQVCFLAMSLDGRLGAFSLQPGFQYAVRDRGRDEVHDARSLFGS